MASDFQYDLVVVGSGPGGQQAAIQGAAAGKRVALIDREKVLGGACVHQGTIPSKTLRESALTLKKLKTQAAFFNFDLPSNIEVESLMYRLDEVLSAHSEFIDETLQTNQIDRIHGRARLLDEHTVEVMAVKGDKRQITFEAIVLATGSRPRTPPEIDVDHENILDSDSILRMIYLPKSMVVMGGGVIGSEYASIFALLGTQVTLLDTAPRPLMFLEEELTNKFVKHFEKFGGRYVGGEKEKSVRYDGVSLVNVELESGEVIQAEKVLVAKGRVSNVERLGLQEVGVEQGKYGVIAVNEFYQTNIPNIYAVGDVIGPPALASCSMEQGRRAVCHYLGEDVAAQMEMIPMGIYSIPEMASVGLNEHQAREEFGEITVGRAHFDKVARGHIGGNKDGMLKLVADGEGNQLLGVQAICDGATDLVHTGEMAIINGNSIDVFLNNVQNFPTLGEAYRIAALDLKDQLKKK